MRQNSAPKGHFDTKELRPVHDFPPRTAFHQDDRNSASQPGKPNGSGGFFSLRWLLILGAIALVVGPILYGAMPEEISRWRQALAQEKYLAGDTEGAILAMDQAIAWYPHSVQLFFSRGKMKFEYRDYAGAVQDFNQGLEIEPQSKQILYLRSSALQRLGRHSEAISDLETLRDLVKKRTGPGYATVLNNLAYVRAVGRQDLKQALQEIEQALQIAGPNEASLDTRGYLYYLTGDLEKAARDMKEAVKLGEKAYQKVVGQTTRQSEDVRQWELQTAQAKYHFGVILYHQALVLQKRGMKGDQQRAAQLLKRVREEMEQEPNDQLY